MIARCRPAFHQDRTWRRARLQGLSQLVCLSRHTVTGRLCASGGQGRDWTAEYRLFSKPRFDFEQPFAVARRELCARLPEPGRLVAAMDDTIYRKRGSKIHGVAWKRDPLSPKFHVNLIRGQRRLQIAGALPLQSGPGPALSIPLDLVHAPSPQKPKPKDPPEAWALYRQAQRVFSLSRLGAQRMARLRQAMDQDPGGRERELLMTVDGSFTNQTVLRNLPPRTDLIGRIRGDAKMFFPPPVAPAGPGRKKSYGPRAPTPEQLRQDDSIPWQTVPGFAAGKEHRFKVKTLGPLLWPTAGPKLPLLLVVIAPLGYRPRKGSKLLYRKPAYLICTRPQLPLEIILQDYVWRWGIEVNHREEKQIFGVGQAQVRTENSVQNDPALATALYAFLLLAGHQASSSRDTHALWPAPKWRKNLPHSRPSTQDLVNRLRFELWGKALGLSDGEDWEDRLQQRSANHDLSELEPFTGFATAHPADTKPEKFLPLLTPAILYACN